MATSTTVLVNNELDEAKKEIRRLKWMVEELERRETVALIQLSEYKTGRAFARPIDRETAKSMIEMASSCLKEWDEHNEL